MIWALIAANALLLVTCLAGASYHRWVVRRLEATVERLDRECDALDAENERLVEAHGLVTDENIALLRAIRDISGRPLTH